MNKLQLSQLFARVTECWSPKIVGELNGQHLKVVKLLGEFPWHHHATEDELFLVVHGSFVLDWRDSLGQSHALELAAGEGVIVPRLTEHRPRAVAEAHVLLFEPAGTLNTGNLRNHLTVDQPEALSDPT